VGSIMQGAPGSLATGRALKRGAIEAAAALHFGRSVDSGSPPHP
jgi:hypothetical protein